MEFVGISDLAGRWIYTRQGVHKLVGRGDFPRPVFAVNNGRVKVWKLADVMRFEAYHPELTSEACKTQKQIGFYRARLKGKQGADATDTQQ